jgi:hypothetical protein
METELFCRRKRPYTLEEAVTAISMKEEVPPPLKKEVAYSLAA